jgi:hypothetical protein
VTLTRCIVGRSRTHTVVTEETSWFCGGGGECGAGRGVGGLAGSSQCWSVSQGVHVSLLPTMASIASDVDMFAKFKEESRKQYVRMWSQFLYVSVVLMVCYCF